MNERQEHALRVQELREHIAKGLNSAKSGPVRDGKAVVARLRAQLDKAERARPER